MKRDISGGSAMRIGYARVSTGGQDLALQRAKLQADGCERVYAEKVSGAKRERAQLDRMLDALRPGDLVVVTTLDRLARSTRDLLDIAGPKRLLYAAVIIGAPIVEEIFFRGLLLRGLAKHFDDRLAVIVSAVLFAGTHFQLARFPGLFVVGIVFAELVRRTGRLGPAIAAHMAFNATAVAILT